MVIAPTVEDTAEYKCVVSNEAGNESRSIYFTVVGEKHVCLWVILLSATGPMFDWLKQDRIFLSHHLTVLTLPSSLVPPSIADEATEITVTRLSPVVIACSATGVPEPTLQWSKDGLKLPSKGQGLTILPAGQFLRHVIPNNVWAFVSVVEYNTFLFVFPLGQIEIPSSELSHAGHYSCTAKNIAGSAHRRVRLTVQGMGKPLEQSLNYDDDRGRASCLK